MPICSLREVLRSAHRVEDLPLLLLSAVGTLVANRYKEKHRRDPPRVMEEVVSREGKGGRVLYVRGYDTRDPEQLEMVRLAAVAVIRQPPRGCPALDDQQRERVLQLLGE
jgi:hypothetical protein